MPLQIGGRRIRFAQSINQISQRWHRRSCFVTQSLFVGRRRRRRRRRGNHFRKAKVETRGTALFEKALELWHVALAGFVRCFRHFAPKGSKEFPSFLTVLSLGLKKAFFRMKSSAEA